MPSYIRARVAGGTYFFTAVTFRRRSILISPESRAALRHAIDAARKRYPFRIDAWVLLPDHLHCIWTLPEGDTDYSVRWGIIKAGYSSAMRPLLHRCELETPSREKRRELSIWQRRFWEHLIRDHDDLRRHMDYTHFNPVKHGLVERVVDWPYSSFHRLVVSGVYPADWGTTEPFDPPDFGE